VDHVLYVNEVKGNLTEVTTRRNFSQILLSVVLSYLHKCQIPCAFGWRAYLSVRQEEGAFLLSTVYQFERCLSSQEHGACYWVVRFCQPSVQSPISWSWLPTVEALGCLTGTQSPLSDAVNQGVLRNKSMKCCLLITMVANDALRNIIWSGLRGFLTWKKKQQQQEQKTKTMQKYKLGIKKKLSIGEW